MADFISPKDSAESFYRSPIDEDGGVSYDDDDDDGCFSSSHLSESEGNAAALSGNGGGNKNDFETPSIQRVDRKNAERLLLDADLVPGSYLVRESDSRPRNYVLTYVSSSCVIYHFRISSVCGHYFISQHEFSTLSDLVRYFSLHAIVAGNEYLLRPVAPDHPVELAKRRVITLVPFCAMKDTDELSFTKGDVLVVHQDFENGWLWATLERTMSSGLVYSRLTEDLACSNQNPDKLSYVHPHISRQDAVLLVAQAGAGGYVVTPSESSRGNYTLLVNCGRRIERFQIMKSDGGYEIGGRFFEGVHDIISRYSQLSIFDDVQLTAPVLKQSSTPDNNVENDLYQKLCSNPVTSRSSCPDAIKCGYLNFKRRKRWKLMYFLLKDVDGQLFCYENEKRTKPKIILELFCCTLYLIHRSLFGQPYCFELIQSGFGVALYFYASSISDYEEWISLLRPLCCGNRECPSPFNSIRNWSSSSSMNQLRKLNHLTIRIDKAKSLSAKTNSELSAVISLNEAKVCRTAAVLWSDSAVWDEKFVFDDVPHEISTITVAIKSRTKKSREVKLGSFKISVSCDDQCGFACDDWFYVQTTGPTWRLSNSGQCHVTINYWKEVVLPLEEYRSLADLIRDDSFALCHCLSSVCADDRQKLAEALLLSVDASGTQLVMAEIKREVDGSDDVRMLFRSGSLAVALMDELMLREGHNYATTVLKSALDGLIMSKVILEIDQSKLDKATNLESNVEHMLVVIGSICDKIFDSVGFFPKVLRQVLVNVKEVVSQKWPKDPLVGLRAISSFVFLRLFCLILALPKQYQLLPDNSSTGGHRNLLVIAKILQSIANFSDIVAKRDSDAVSNALSELSSRIRPSMIAFLNAISEPLTNGLEVASTRRQPDPARYLATIFHICQKHITGIKSQENKHASVRNLLSVLELLDCHQKRYVGGTTVSVV